MVYTVLKFPKNKHEHNEIKFRNYKKFNMNSFLQELKECQDIVDVDWEVANFDIRWDAFKNEFIKVSKQTCPYPY